MAKRRRFVNDYNQLRWPVPPTQHAFSRRPPPVSPSPEGEETEEARGKTHNRISPLAATPPKCNLADLPPRGERGQIEQKLTRFHQLTDERSGMNGARYSEGRA
jgi:hypothetical protein